MTKFHKIEVGFKGVKIILACFRDAQVATTHSQESNTFPQAPTPNWWPQRWRGSENPKKHTEATTENEQHKNHKPNQYRWIKSRVERKTGVTQMVVFPQT